jgi:hypothetical protein
MKFHLGHLLGLSAIIVAGCAAFFSVYGLSQLFAGASLAVIIMASALELSKLVAASFLHRFWDNMSKVLRVYLTVGVMVLVTITSAGIYGFLSNAYQKTAFSLGVHEGEVGVVQGKINIFESKLTTNKELIDSKNERISQLSDLRAKQEVRLDSMINRRYFSNANATRDEISKANSEIQKLTSEVDDLVVSNSAINDSIGKYQVAKLEMQANSDVAAEIGPLKYMAELTGKPMDVVVNFFILLLIFVFDPLAISLVVATSWVFMNRNKKGEDNPMDKVREKYLSKTWVTPEPEDKPTEVVDGEEDGVETMSVPKDFGKIQLDEETVGLVNNMVNRPNEATCDPVTGDITQEDSIPSPDMVEDIEVNGPTVVEIQESEEEPKVEVVEPAKEEESKRRPLTVEDVQKIKSRNTERGFSVEIPKSTTNKVERVGSNKFLEDNKKIAYRNKR